MERLSASREDYLEAILLLLEKEPVVRVRDLARYLGVRMASVTGMVKTLAKDGLVVYKPYGYVLLTDEGRSQAERVLHRHKAIKEFLVSVLGVVSERAEEVACRLEHVLDGEMVERFAAFSEFVRRCPRCGGTFLAHFVRFCEKGAIDEDECKRCVLGLGGAEK